MHKIARAPWLANKAPWPQGYTKTIEESSTKKRIIKKPKGRPVAPVVVQMFGIDEIRISASKNEELAKLFKYYGGTFDYDRGCWIWSRSTAELKGDWESRNLKMLSINEYKVEKPFKGKKMQRRKGLQTHRMRRVTGADGSSYVKKLSYYSYTQRELLQILKLMSQDLEAMGVELQKLISKKEVGSGNRNSRGLL